MKSNKYMRINFLLSTCLWCICSLAQHSWVYLKDKCGATDFFNASICEDYLSTFRNDRVSVVGKSRWLNAVCIPNSQTEVVSSYPFVSHISPIRSYTSITHQIDQDFSYGYSDWQLKMVGLDSFHRAGYTGSNIILALFDGGFWKVDSLPQFSSMWANQQIQATRDFVKNDSMSFNESTHGMQVLALAGINYPDSMVGSAPGANFVLARTENTFSETHLEELNWMNALEWADSIGVDIIHSSLGYSLFDSLEGDYTYNDMDGKSTIISISAQMAAERGIFITNSAGNSGNDPWFHITAPCDAKDVLCVGAVDSFRRITNFSSRGPSSDGRIKPDVCAMGRRNTIPSASGILQTGSGTSYSGPIIAGMVACLKSAHPTKSNQQLFRAILQSSDRYTNPDNEYGYGVPNVLRADSILNQMPLSIPKSETTIRANVFPNPANNHIQLRVEPGSKCELMDFKGNLLDAYHLNNWMNFIDISNISAGKYLLKITKNHRIFTQKLIIEH